MKTKGCHNPYPPGHTGRMGAFILLGRVVLACSAVQWCRRSAGGGEEEACQKDNKLCSSGEATIWNRVANAMPNSCQK